MNWFENNPLGKALAWVCVGLAVISLLLAWAWNWPVSSEVEEVADVEPVATLPGSEAFELDPLGEYQVINDRPLFNESRRPIIGIEDEETGIVIDTPVADVPEVRLTGVIITPDQRMATLSPTGEGKPVIAYEGQPLDGEFVGWTVRKVYPRGVRMVSADGGALDLELMVHNQTIAEPPKPEPPPPEEDPEADEEMLDEDGEPLTRAEEIRRRIQERREQLRREADQEREAGDEEQTEQRNQYQQAIRNLVGRKRDNDNEREEQSDDDE